MVIPDCNNPQYIAIVWPEHLRAGRANKLIEFYMELIDLLREHDIKLRVLFCTANGKFAPPHFLLDDEVTPFKEIADIWIRDYAPIALSGDRYAKFKYQPAYLSSETNKEYAEIDDKNGNKLALEWSHLKPIEVSINGKPLILDGGNFIHNGQGVGIVSNRIIADNENVFVDDIRKTFREHLGIHELHIIPVEPGDDTGHADGLVRFLSHTDLLISSYPYQLPDSEEYISDTEYKSSIDCVESIAEYFTGKFEIHRMPNGVPQNSKDFESAVGNYTNFLRVGEKIFLPYYGNEEQYENARKELIKARIAEENIIQTPDCTHLAEEGGVLNCITAHVF